MEEVKVKIVGIAPMLMNRFKMEKPEDTKAKRKDEQYSPETDAENALYRDEKIGIYAPCTWLEACLREAGKEIKKGKSSYKETIKSSVFITPEMIPLNKKTYDEIDLRAVVIQRNRVAKGRPKFNSWALEFNIKYDEKRIKKDTLKQILEEAGATKGIGDYRPKFGRFKVEKFE